MVTDGESVAPLSLFLSLFFREQKSTEEYIYPELSPVLYTHEVVELPDSVSDLPHWCPSVPTIVIHFCEDHEPEFIQIVSTPTQYTMYGARLCVPGFLSYEDENVSPAVWEKWEHEEEQEEEQAGGLTSDDGEEDDSEVEDDVGTWTYYSGEDLPRLEETKKNVNVRALIPDKEVKITFWIDEDEDELPDISDWSS